MYHPLVFFTILKSKCTIKLFITFSLTSQSPKSILMLLQVDPPLLWMTFFTFSSSINQSKNHKNIYYRTLRPHSVIPSYLSLFPLSKAALFKLWWRFFLTGRSSHIPSSLAQLAHIRTNNILSYRASSFRSRTLFYEPNTNTLQMHSDIKIVHAPLPSSVST